MTKRVFLAIDLPAETKNEIAKIVSKVKLILPKGVRFIPEENWHITLMFFGDKPESEISKIQEVGQDEIRVFPALEVSFTSITYGPSEKKPRMIWANINPSHSRKIEDFTHKLGKSLEGRGVPIKKETRGLNAHVTLARIADHVEKPNLPPLTLPLNAKFKIAGATLFESKLYSSGAEYSVIATFPLKLSSLK